MRGKFIVTLVIAAALMMWPLASAAPAADTSLAAGTSGPGAAVPTVGALFTVSDGKLGTHFCTASVVDSPAGDMLVTAAHCLTGYSLTAPAGIAFVPGYSQGATPYGIWTVTRAFVDAAWAASTSMTSNRRWFGITSKVSTLWRISWMPCSAIDERLTQIENATRAQSTEIAQDSARLSDAKLADAKPADDVPLRRLVAASLLDVLVRTGDPYAAALSAAKSLTDNADALKPIDGFAASGGPSAAVLCRELLTLVPKLSPPAQDTATTGAGIIERLQAGASKLVRIERTDVVGNDRGAIVARVTAAALRNDYAEARRELNTLASADRAAAQPWIDKADARDAALATSRQFANAAMAALAKPAP